MLELIGELSWLSQSVQCIITRVSQSPCVDVWLEGNIPDEGEVFVNFT